MHLHKTAFGLAAGILCGVSVLIATLWVLAVGGGEHLELLAKFYLGYGVSLVGAFIGLVWGFVEGFVVGWLFAWLYNRFTPGP